MNIIKSVLIAVICFASSGIISAQTNHKPEKKKNKTVYYYKFEGAKSIEEVRRLEGDVYALKGVTEFKSEFKPETNLAQIIVVVLEKPRTTEGEILFQITDLKKILEKKGYVPLELVTEELPAE